MEEIIDSPKEEQEQKIEPKINKKSEIIKEAKPIKHKTKVAQKGLIALQFTAWFLAILSLFATIFVAIAPKKVASVLLTQQILEQSYDIETFIFLVPHYCIMLTIIALLFYFISVLIRVLVRYRNEVNQLQDENEK